MSKIWYSRADDKHSLRKVSDIVSGYKETGG